MLKVTLCRYSLRGLRVLCPVLSGIQKWVSRQNTQSVCPFVMTACRQDRARWDAAGLAASGRPEAAVNLPRTESPSLVERKRTTRNEVGPLNPPLLPRQTAAAILDIAATIAQDPTRTHNGDEVAANERSTCLRRRRAVVI